MTTYANKRPLPKPPTDEEMLDAVLSLIVRKEGAAAVMASLSRITGKRVDHAPPVKN